MGISYPEILPGMTDAQLAAALDDDVALGVGWIRFDIGWEAVQPDSPTTYDWSAFDRITTAANQRGLSMLPILNFTPAWARSPGCTWDHCAPANPAQFATFAAAAAARYAPLGIHAWEVWNEPNTGGAWAPSPSVSQYVSVLQATVPAIKAVDRSATVISGGLAPSATDATDISQLDWIAAFAQAGGLALVDAVGYHPYSFPVPPGTYETWSAWSQMASTPTSLQSVMGAAGYPNMKLWGTEYGAPTNGPGIAASPTNYQLNNSPDHVTEDLQAIMATQSVQLAKSSSLLGALFWYTGRDAGTNTASTENFFGLRRYDGSQKPAWAALQAAVAAAKP